MSGSCTALIVFLITFSCNFPCAVLQDNGVCQSEYIEQPPDQLTCNPYPNDELSLECTVSLLTSGAKGGPLAIEWFHSPTSPPITTGNVTTENIAINRLNNVQENVMIPEQQTIEERSMVRVRSRLEVAQLDEFGVGKFWCGIRIGSMEWMVPSDPVLLQPPDEYANLLPCGTTEVQSKQERKCALWSFTSTSTATIGSETPSSNPQPVTSSGTTGATAGGETTTADSNPQPVTSSGTIGATAGGETTTADSNPQPVTGTTGATAGGDSNPQPVTSPLSSGTGATAGGETTTADNGGRGPFTEFYIAVAVVVALGSIITFSVILVVCMYIRLRGKRSTCPEEEKAQTVVVHSPTTTATATDYLVPLSLGDQQQVVKVQPLVGDNPVYLTNVHRDMTSLWLQRQQQRSSEGLEHSYESMTHDYEDIFLESLNGGVVLMQSNEAYTIPRTLTYNSGHVLALYNSQ